MRIFAVTDPEALCCGLGVSEKSVLKSLCSYTTEGPTADIRIMVNGNIW